jgi:hypothetical protein
VAAELPRLNVAAEASFLEVWGQYASECRFISRRFPFGKPERHSEPVLTCRMKVPGFEQARNGERQAIDFRKAEEKT